MDVNFFVSKWLKKKKIFKHILIFFYKKKRYKCVFKADESYIGIMKLYNLK